MSLPRSRAELPRLIYSSGSLWSLSGELLAVLGGPRPPETPPEAVRAFLGRVALALRQQALFFLQGGQEPLDPDHPQLWGARRAALGSFGWDENYLILSRSAAPRWDRRRELPDGEYVWGERLCPGGAFYDPASWKALPPSAEFSEFSWKAESTGLASAPLSRRGIVLIARAEGESMPVLAAVLPAVGARAPGEGWVNAFRRVWELHTGLRVSVLQDEEGARASLEGQPVWTYRAGIAAKAGSAWRTVEIVPSRRALADWAGRDAAPWSLSAGLRLWHRPGELPENPDGLSVSERLEAVWQSLSPADLRLAWENSVIPAFGPVAADLFPLRDRLPYAVRSVLKPSVRAELDRRMRLTGDKADEASLVLDVGWSVEKARRTGKFAWSPHAEGVWKSLWLDPFARKDQAELDSLATPETWNLFLSENAPTVEETLRRLDLTDLALCLRLAPDGRWRRHVSAGREAEVRREMDYCAALEKRGELSRDRVLDAWRCFHQEWKSQVQQRQK